MKIIQFLNNTGSHMGGVEQCTINYSRSLLHDNKNEVHTLIPNKDVSYRNHLHGNIYELNINNKLRLFFELFRIIKTHKPDFFILHTSRGLRILKYLSKIYKFKIIGINHGFNLKKFVKNADIIFCINKNQIKESEKLINNNKTRIIYFPNATEVNQTLNIKNFSSPPIIGTLSRIDFKYKNLDKIVLAAKILKEREITVIFKIGGDYGEIDRLKAMVNELELNDYFIFKGLITDKTSFFKEIDIFCMPSSEETFGLSYIESMSNSVPCIATNTHGANDIFDDNVTGFIIPKDNPKQIPVLLADKIENILSNQDLCKQIATNAYYFVNDNFSLDSMRKRFLSVSK
jgi:glycosyltransferase involved in cell wall biosynthesis